MGETMGSVGQRAGHVVGHGRFELIAPVGSGAVGHVYEAYDRRGGLRVAIKMLRELTAETLLHLKREFRVIQDLHHRNLVRFGELFEEDGQWFFSMEFVEGTSFLDDKYAKNKAGAMGNGILFGAYHFARPGSNDPVKEADWFVNNMGLQHGMMIPAMDLEVTGGLGVTALTNWTKAWLQRVADRTGVKPLIYTSPSFWRNNLNDTRWFADNGYSILWVAHWGVTSPSVPGSNWGGHSWTFWQYTSDGTVPGISGRVDLNRYHFDSFAPVTY